VRRRWREEKLRQQASMAVGDVMPSRLGHSSSSPVPVPLPNHHHSHVPDDLPVVNGPKSRNGLEAADVEKPAPVAYLPQVVVLCEQRHEGIDDGRRGRAIHQRPRLQMAVKGPGNRCAACSCCFYCFCCYSIIHWIWLAWAQG